MIPLRMVRTLLESEDRWAESGHLIGKAMDRWLDAQQSPGTSAIDAFYWQGGGLRDALNQLIKKHPIAGTLTNYDLARPAGNSVIAYAPLPPGVTGAHAKNGHILLSHPITETLKQAGMDYRQEPHVRFHHKGSTPDIGNLIDTKYHEALHGLEPDHAHEFRGFSHALIEANNTLATHDLLVHHHGPLPHPHAYVDTIMGIHKAAMEGLGHSYSKKQMFEAMQRASWMWKGSLKETDNENAWQVYARNLAEALPLVGEDGKSKMNMVERRNDLEPEFRKLHDRMKTWTSSWTPGS